MRLLIITAVLGSALALATPAWSAPVPGLVAAYSFDEGSGVVVNDSSGNGHTGSVVGATWTAGRYGGALSLDGVGNYVNLGQLGTFYTSGFTLEAWVQKRTTKNDAAVLGTWTGTATGGPMIWVDHIATHYMTTFGQTYSNYLDSGRNPIVGQWQHLAATYDGTTARFYIDGTEVANRTVSPPVGSSNLWRVGAYDTSPSGFFDGLVDDVRVYNRALSAAEVQTDMDTPLGLADTNAPTMPGNFATTSTTTNSIGVQWTASTDDNGVSGYRLYSNGTQVGTTSGTSFTFTGLSCSNTYTLGVEAYDGSGNTSPRATVTGSTGTCTGGQLVAAYGFDDGSGSVAADASGNGHPGSIVGATWTAGRYGGGLSFNGNGNYVNLGQLGTFYTGGFTLEAWVQKASATKGDTAIVGTWTGGNGGPMLWTDLTPHYRLTLGSTFSNYLDSGQSPVAGQWQHLAATFDGSTARFYVNGVQTASSAFSGSAGTSNTWRIGAYDSSPLGFFDGVLDEVRVYDAVRSATQIQSDMTTPLNTADVTAPTVPSSVTATGGFGQAALTWAASTDDRAVTRYNVHRSTTSGFAPTAANRIAQPTGTSYTDTGLAPGTYYYKVTAEDAAGNVSAPSAEVSATVTGDSSPPTVSITNPADGTNASGIVTISANAQDNQAVAGVQFRLDGQNSGAEDQSAPYSQGWDTRGEINGSHTITAVARDNAGNTTVSAPVQVTVSNAGVSTQGLKIAYALDDGSGSLAVDNSGNYATGTLVNAGWSNAGKFGGAVSLTGSAEVDPPALGTFYSAGFTLEAWVNRATSKNDDGIVGSWVGSQGGGPMLWIDGAGHYRLTLGSTLSNYLDSGQTAAVGQWQHVAATFDGSQARFYVNGVLTASSTFTGSVGSSNTWRIGAYNATPEGFFPGLIDNVRVYNRPLTASEIQVDMASRVQPDQTPPTVTSTTPADGANQVGVTGKVTAKFSEPMRSSTISGSTFTLRDAANNVVPASVTYDSSTATATLTPSQALDFSTAYQAVLTSGATDLSGNGLAANASWSFTTDSAPPPVLVIGSTANPFTTYLGEILRTEGLNEFTSIDISLVSPSLLSHENVVVLGDMTLSATQVTMLTSWVNAGGTLIAMHPDKQLAGLLGLTDSGTTLGNAYLKVDTTTTAGSGIVGASIQYHGSADRYTLNGATAIASLYSDATTATSSPAVSWRAVGANGGKAIAFTYDLARSIAYTRQGNPAWVGQNRDNFEGIAPDDLYYGARSGDVQPDWVNTNKIAIPQADEQQRLLANLITVAASNRLPLPRFWYLPRGVKAALALTSDDHSTTNAPGGTAYRFDRLNALSTPGCVVANWQCVRATSFIFPVDALTNAQATSYVNQGFELALHPVFGSCPTTVQTQAQIAATYAQQLSDLRAKYTGIPVPVTNRNHCYYWPDWSSVPKVELANGARMDFDYAHYPNSWIGNKPGFMTGSGFPMRFADSDGTPIDVYQEATHVDDDGTTAAQTPAFIASLLDNAVGSPGYYGAFGVLIHADNPIFNQQLEDVVAAAQARNVPIVSGKQLLDWTDGRNSSTIRDLQWNAGTLTFTVSAAAGANGLQTMVPTQGPSGTLTGITRGGSAVAYTVQTIKGISYAMFDSPSGAYVASYG
jgi:chitodextrinase